MELLEGLYRERDCRERERKYGESPLAFALRGTSKFSLLKSLSILLNTFLEYKVECIGKESIR